MRYIDEYREADQVAVHSRALERLATRDWTIMEICGGQTHAIMRYGLDELLPQGMRLLHGPGCPVCVTPAGLIDAAAEISLRPDTVLCSFGDMLRVPGLKGDLFSAKASGGKVSMVYSPLDALKMAERDPGTEVVFFAVGFETTVPVTATAVLQAESRGVKNFSLLVSHVRVPPALEGMLNSPGNRINGVLAAGHVCAVTGYEDYEDIAGRFGVPITVTGFEPLDIVQGILMTVGMLEDGRVEVENQYSRAVSRKGAGSWELARRVFEFCDMEWRGMGFIPSGGFRLKERWSGFDAMRRFGLAPVLHEASSTCRSAEVLRGIIEPDSCPSFGTSCTPQSPLGAPMVSSEGACAAYYRYGRIADE